MKLLGIGDRFIPGDYIEKGMQILKPYGVDIAVEEWKVGTFDELQKINLTVEQGGRDRIPVPEEIKSQAEDAEILITQFFPISKELIDSCKRLKLIGILRGGYENVDVEYAKSKGIRVFHSVGRNAQAVSDFTIGLLIAEARNIARGHDGLMHGKWLREYPNSESIPDLEDKTVGIIGYGEIGRLVAKKLSGFDVTILIYDPYDTQQDPRKVTLNDLLTRSDFITLHARLTEENRHMIGAKELALMKPSAYLINTSRAGLVDEQALYDALKDRRIAGAALDVFEKEPPGEDYPFVTLDNVTLTPHMAGGSMDAFYNTPKLLGREIAAYLNGESSRFLL